MIIGYFSYLQKLNKIYEYGKDRPVDTWAADYGFECVFQDTIQGREREVVVRQRVNQQFFRDAVLTAYLNQCCVTGITNTPLLAPSSSIRASVMKMWTERWAVPRTLSIYWVKLPTSDPKPLDSSKGWWSSWRPVPIPTSSWPAMAGSTFLGTLLLHQEIMLE